MATPFIDFRPAQVMGDKEVYVCYYVLDPTNEKLKRMRIRCNRIKNRREQRKYASLICAETNRKLYPYGLTDTTKNTPTESTL